MSRVTRRPRTPPPADPAPDWGARLKDLATLIAPTTVITSLLVYFGYVGTRARFAYFGVYLDLTELSNQSLVLYGLEVLYVPVALALLAVLAVIACHTIVSWLVGTPRHARAALVAAAVAGIAGVLLVARALIGILVLRVSRTEQPGTSALALTFGPVLIAYGGWVAGVVLARRSSTTFPERYARLRRVVTVTAAGLVLIGLFWAANSFAWAFGQGRAYEDARDLPSEPEVVLDTAEPLVDLPYGVTETALPAAADDEFKYRYRGLRLLVAAGDRLFLVPAHWTDEGRTLVVPYDDKIRLQLDP